MHNVNVFETEIGIKDYSLEFINTTGQFIKLRPETDGADMLISVIHDENGKVSSLSLISTEKLEEICLIDGQKAQKISGKREKASELLKRFRDGSVVNVPEMLMSIWNNVKPLAVEAAATA